MATVKENLIAARALIDTPEKWVKGGLSNDASTCFCIVGAVAYRGGEWSLNTSQEEFALSEELLDGFRGKGLAYFNDHRKVGHSDVMALFDRAIAAQGDAP